ncbi:MAG: SDR family NAD(P)-dependent oxidoreductase [Proteobacteria bacterium]|nr:SDR family NAD(P)-dependent oxidoreductase [Pseudomonadota bacterium]
MSDDATTARLRDAVRTIQALRERLAAVQAERSPPIAIVGMSCRFAGADNPDALWDLLAAGRDAIRPTPADRWDNAHWFSADPEAPGRVAFRDGGFLDDVDGFDNELFGIAAREAAGMDPQHRLLLELAWSALESAAIRPDNLGGTSTGVYLGLNGGDHMVATLAAPERLGTHALAGAVGSLGAGRIAYALGLNGPAMVVDTACSSSLVAAHLAVQALRRGECDVALTGGVHLMLAPNVSVALSRARMMAPDGRCKAFDAAADGFGQGEGGGMLVLKRLADAQQAGDRILAVIAGSALNQDGRSAGITAPNQRAQAAVIRAALADAGLAAEAVDAIEAHGTGTALGDPVELHAIASLHAGRQRPLAVGSIKANIGHTAAAAGVAGLIKSVLMLRHGAIPATPHFKTLNPHVDLGGVPIAIAKMLQPAGDLATVGISSFGFSGTNAHVLVSRAPEAAKATAPAGPMRLLITARTEAALRTLIAAYREAFSQGRLAFADACTWAARGRARLSWWVCVDSPEQLANAVPSQGPLPVLPEMPGGTHADLPLYPFQRQTFARVRLPDANASAPFPGRLVVSPSADRQLDCVLDLALQSWLGDHRVHGRVVVPGAVMIALLLAVAPQPADALEDIVFVEPVLLDGGPVRLCAIARPDGSLGVASRSGSDWTWHATARVGRAAPAVVLGAPTPTGKTLSRDEWISHLAALGIDIGPVFQAIESISTGATTRAVLDRSVLGAPVGGAFHPALLDAALQVAGGTLPADPVLPVGIARLVLHGSLAEARDVTARLDGDRIDLAIAANGRPIATVEGLEVRRLADAMPPVVAALDWVALPLAEGGTSSERFDVEAESLPLALHALQTRTAGAAPLSFVARSAERDPAIAAFAGLASAVAEERPDLGCRFIEIAPGTPDRLLAAELSAASPEPFVALRPEGRFVPRLVPRPRSAETVRLSGTVLITGGLGGVGLHTARWAVSRGAEAVLLVGRQGGIAPADLPARVLALDIAAPEAVDALVAALAGMPPLTTIVHTAGVLRDGLLDKLQVADFEAVLAPKLRGARNLHVLSQRLPVEHFLLFGSVASMIGAAGQSTYATANAALDAFAVWRRAQGLPATSIAWGRWSGTGFAATLSAAQTARVAARGLLGMTPERALAALDTAILCGAAVVMVAAIDPPRLAASAPPVFSNLVPPPVAETGSIAEQVAGLVRLVLGQPVQPGLPLITCGLDSLMATDLRNRLNRRFGTGLGIAALMDGADVDGLVATVESAMAHGETVEEMTL